ncbi:polyprotein [Vitis vinifera]|uniref:Polyprotein n=1 Tax=Vitis vinifera TaxID=29760 RepID=A0A438BR69_VITVI|nr:polyprotein [Vitis vinifera]
MKSGFWQIQIADKDRYKAAFVVPFGHYEWNVMPFGLKNAPSEFQNIMNEIFNQFSNFIIVYIDDVLIHSDFVEPALEHLNKFVETIKLNGLSLSATKINLFQTKSQDLTCLALTDPKAFKIVETDASDIGYGGILKQRDDSKTEDWIHKIMAPKKEKQSLKPIKKSPVSMKPHSAL